MQRYFAKNEKLEIEVFKALVKCSKNTIFERMLFESNLKIEAIIKPKIKVAMQISETIKTEPNNLPTPSIRSNL